MHTTTPQTTTVSVRTALRANNPVLTPVERHILAGLGGKPFTEDRLDKALLADAKKMLLEASHAVGFKKVGWMTTHRTNVKLSKAGIPTIGVTLHAARSAAMVWGSLDPAERQALAEAVRSTVEDVTSVLRLTVCPCATKGCKMVCVVAMSQRGQLSTSVRSRLVRTVITLMRPTEACALTLAALITLRRKHSYSKARWRTNVADDIRWEYLAPGLFGHVKAYAYTKFSPAQRPNNIKGLTVVYSATEHTTAADVRRVLDSGQRVALVLDVPKGKLPATWHGMPVVDGDSTDDLWKHPMGTIVGLVAKGTLAQRAQMRASGFAH